MQICIKGDSKCISGFINEYYIYIYIKLADMFLQNIYIYYIEFEEGITTYNLPLNVVKLQ